MEQNFIFITTQELGLGANWMILCDQVGQPFTDIERAVSYVRTLIAQTGLTNVGLSQYDSMIRGAIDWDNF